MRMEQHCDGFALLDFKRAAYGRLTLRFEPETTGSITVAIGECRKEGRLNPEPGGSRYYAGNTVKKGSRIVHFEIPGHVAPNPNAPKIVPEHGEIAPFRYVQIDGYSGNVSAEREEIFQDFRAGDSEFQSSDENLNRIWDFCKYSIQATTAFGIYVDGNRERRPYEGDACLNQLGHFCSTAEFTLAKRTIEYLLEHPTWPTEWLLLMPIIAEDYLLYSGDRESIENWLPQLDGKLLPELTGPDGFLSGNDRIRDIVDWPPSERDQYDFGKFNTVPNCYLYAALNSMHRLTGKNDYRNRAENLRKNIRARMMKKGLFLDHPGSTHSSLHSAVFGIFAGVADPSEFSALGTFLRSKGMACSVYGAQFLLDACCMIGLDSYARERMTSRDLRSWNNMLEKGSTITMEAWDDSFKPNQDWNHAWGAAPANVIPRRICGIRPVAPGFSEFVFDPRFAGLTKIHLKHPTIHGPVGLDVSNGEILLTIPEGSTGIFRGERLRKGTHRLSVSGI